MRRSRLKSDSILPAPRTTDDSGSSASCTGRPVSSRRRLSRFFSIDAAAGEDDAAIEDVGRQLRRNPLERVVHRLHDRADRLRQRLADFLVVHRDRLRPAFAEVPAFDFHRQPLLERERGADLDLDLLGGPLADEQVVRLARVLDDRLVELVAGDAHRLAVDDARQRDDRDVGRAAADVDRPCCPPLR